MIAGYSTLWDLLLVDDHHLVASGPLLSPDSDGLLFTRYLDWGASLLERIQKEVNWRRGSDSSSSSGN